MQNIHKNDSYGYESVRNVEMKQDLQESDQFEIDLVELLYALLEKAKYIVLASILGAILFGAYTMFMITPKYTATSKLYIMNSGEMAINLSDFQVGNYLTADYQEVFKNWHVHEMVIQELNLPYSYGAMRSMLSVSNPENTRILYIKVTSPSAQEAKLIADTYAAKAQEFIASTMDTRMPSLFEEALLPTSTSSPNKTRNVILGFMLGMLIACAIIVVKFLMDDRIHNSEDIEKHLGMTVLGIMTKQSAKQNAQNNASKQSKRKEQ